MRLEANQASQASQASKQRPPPGGTRAPAPASSDSKRKRGLGYPEPKPLLAQRAPKRAKPGSAQGLERTQPPTGGAAQGEKRGGEGGGGGGGVGMEGAASASAPPPFVYSDQCTAFVSNLPLHVREEEVRGVFAACGALKDVRMVLDRVTKRFKVGRQAGSSDDALFSGVSSKGLPAEQL